MSLQFVIGRSGSGKTTYILEHIREQLRANAEGPSLILITPEQGTFQLEYELVKTPDLHGIMRAQVLSFRRLAYRIMQETGGTALTPILDEGKKMLLYKLIHHLKDRLSLYENSADQLGFVDRLNDFYNELKRYKVDPDQLDRAAKFVLQQRQGDQQLFSNKLSDLITIYHEYTAMLANFYVDSEDMLRHLAHGIGQTELLRHTQIWIDGFHGFTPQEYDVIAQLLQVVDKVTVTCCLDQPYDDHVHPHELNLFYPSASTYVRLRNLAEELGVTIDETIHLNPLTLPRFQQSPMLAHLESAYEHRKPWKTPSLQSTTAGVVLLTASNRRAEVEGVAREMIRLAKEEGARWRDMALFVRQMSDYAQLVETVFTDAKIPFFIDQKSVMSHHPLVSFIQAACDVVNERWTYEAVFRCIKTDLLIPQDQPITPRDLDLLENYVLAKGIRGSKWLDDAVWQLPLDRSGYECDDHERIQRCRAQVMIPLVTFAKAMTQASFVREMCKAVFELLEQVQASTQLETWIAQAKDQGRVQKVKEHKQVWDSVLHVLDQIVEMMGEESLSLPLFADVLRTGLENIQLALVPPAMDQVLIGNIDRTRSGNIQYAFLAGVNDGVLPARPKEEGVLTEAEREQLGLLGLELAPGARRQLLDERFLIYRALTVAHKRLWVSCPLANEEGESLLPSELIRQLQVIFPTIQKELLLAEPDLSLTPVAQQAFIAEPRRTLSIMLSQLQKWRRGKEIATCWWQVYDWFLEHQKEHPQLRFMLSSLDYKNQASPLPEQTAKKIYGERLRASVSQVEKYVACPFSYFAQYGLRLRKRLQFQLESPDIGQLYHAVLQNILTQYDGDEASGKVWDEDHIRVRVADSIHTVAPTIQGGILQSSKRYHYIARKLQDVLIDTVIVLSEHLKRGEFKPIGLELAFGQDQSIPPLKFQLDNGCSMEIAGRIDRIDQANSPEGPLLRIIDYKSSQTLLPLYQVVHGLSLQMIVYMDVLLTYAPQWLGQEALPGGILYFHVHRPLLQAPSPLSIDDVKQQRSKRYMMRGLLLADQGAITLMDATLTSGRSDIIPVGVKKDGSFYSYSAVATLPQWDTIRQTARKVMVHTGTRILQGDVAITPYRLSQETPCRFCDYRPVCQLDTALEGNHYCQLNKFGNEQAWQLLTQQEVNP